MTGGYLILFMWLFTAMLWLLFNYWFPFIGKLCSRLRRVDSNELFLELVLSFRDILILFSLTLNLMFWVIQNPLSRDNLPQNVRRLDFIQNVIKLIVERRVRECRAWGGELFQSELFWRIIFMQIRWFEVMNFDSPWSQFWFSLV